jgi:hypothetical protein
MGGGRRRKDALPPGVVARRESSPPFTGERVVAAVHGGENCHRRHVRASECFPTSDGVAGFPRVFAWIGSGLRKYTFTKCIFSGVEFEPTSVCGSTPWHGLGQDPCQSPPIQTKPKYGCRCTIVETN